MRIWSIHPQYLDSKGLVALWRESLLARHVLEDKTKGYRNHPQLSRFKKSRSPVDNINHYLSVIHGEATSRKYNFDSDKVNRKFKKEFLTVTDNQLKYEMEHLLRKLKSRDPKKYVELKKIKVIQPHPIFEVISGDIEDWEIQ